MMTFSAGARNIFILPKVAKTTLHRNLCSHFDIQLSPPRDMDQQFEVFKGIIDACNSGWRFKLLVFPEPWIRYLHERPNNAVSAYVREFSLKVNAFKRNMMFYDFIFSYIKNEFKISANSFVHDVIRQLFCIAAGQIPGFGVVTNNELAPCELIESAYQEVYRLQQSPIIMAPRYLHPFKKQAPVYYSMKKPGFLYSIPSTNSTLKLCLSIKSALDQYSQRILEAGLAKNTVFYRSAEFMNVQVIHDAEGVEQPSEVIKPRSDIMQYDESLRASMLRMNQGKESLPSRSSFFNGCFGINYSIKGA